MKPVALILWAVAFVVVAIQAAAHVGFGPGVTPTLALIGDICLILAVGLQFDTFGALKRKFQTS